MPRPAARSGRGRFDRQVVRESVVPILEFAIAAGLLKWDIDQYGIALCLMFPEQFAPEAALERRIAEAKRNRVAAIKLNNASESETASEPELGAVSIENVVSTDD